MLCGQVEMFVGDLAYKLLNFAPLKLELGWAGKQHQVGDHFVSAHRLALERGPAIGFGRYIISATTPFTPADLGDLRRDAPRVVGRLFPGYEETYARLGWRMFAGIDRVYVNAHARDVLGWRPRHDFRHVLDRLKADEDPRSPLARVVGAKGYHEVSTGPYTVR